MKILVLFCLLFLSIFCQEIEPEIEQNNTVTYDSRGWDPNLTTLSVGDYNYTEKNNLESFKKSHELFLLSISDSNCEEWCRAEVMLKSVSDLIKSGAVGYRDKPIPIIRADYSIYYEQIVAEGLNMNRVPKTFLYFKDQFYPFEEVDNDRLLLHFINRVLYPVVILKTNKDVAKFIQNEDEWEENTPFFKGSFIPLGDEIFEQYTKVTRVVAFITDKSEYKEDVQRLADDARDLSKREDLRVAKITNPSVVADFKSKYGKKWFGEASSNSIVAVVKNKSQKKPITSFYDLNVDTDFFHKWINEVSIEPVEELFGTSIKIISYLQKIMFTAFIDRSTSKKAKESNELLKRMKEIAMYYPQYQMTFTEDPVFKDKKEECGITWEEEPALALHNIYKLETTMVFPRKQPFSKRNLRAFFDACWSGKVNTDEFRLPDRIRNFDGNMKQALKLTSNNYKEILEDFDKDKLVLIFDSSHDFNRGKKITMFFGKAAKRFHELELDGEVFK